VLIVDANALLAIQRAYMLSDAGYQVLGPALTVEMALLFLQKARPIAAVLKILVEGELICPVARRLREMGVPFLMLNQWRPEELPAGGDPAPEPILAEPVDAPTLISTLDGLSALPSKPLN
jgi:hypothetical protein